MPWATVPRPVRLLGRRRAARASTVLEDRMLTLGSARRRKRGRLEDQALSQLPLPSTLRDGRVARGLGARELGAGSVRGQRRNLGLGLHLPHPYLGAPDQDIAGLKEGR